jgi:uncharacterized membrane protein
MFYATPQHDNMFLKIISDLIAFALGFIFVAAPFPQHLQTESTLVAFISNPDTLIYLAKTVFGGCIALFINVTGQKIVHKWKEKRSKGGKSE